MTNPIHIVTIKWGTKYNETDVNRLFFHISKNTSIPICFHCFTDNPAGLHEKIMTHALPDIKIKPEHKKYSYIKEAGLCDDNLGNLKGHRVFFFDLDVLICDNLDDLFSYPKNDDFIIINDWNTRGDHVGQASLYSWVVGTFGFVKDYYEENDQAIIDRFYTASQEYLSYMIIQKFGHLNFWPTPWCVSFKQHCLPKWYLRYFIVPKLPNGAKLIAFHGDPKAENALIGRWADGAIPFYKKIYKKNLPAKWLGQFYEYENSIIVRNSAIHDAISH